MGHVLRNDKLLTERSIKYWRGRVEITLTVSGKLKYTKSSNFII